LEHQKQPLKIKKKVVKHCFKKNKGHLD